MKEYKPRTFSQQEFKESKNLFFTMLTDSEREDHFTSVHNDALIRDAHTPVACMAAGKKPYAKNHWKVRALGILGIHTDKAVNTLNEIFYANFFGYEIFEKVKNAYSQEVAAIGEKIASSMLNCNDPLKPITFGARYRIANFRKLNDSTVICDSISYGFHKKTVEGSSDDIPGYIVALSLLTIVDNKPEFVLQKIECSNDIMYELCMNNSIETTPEQISAAKEQDKAYLQYINRLKKEDPDCTQGFIPQTQSVSKIKSWFKRNPIATGLLIGMGAALLAAGVVTAILLLAPVLPFLAPAALVIGGVAGALYSVLGGFGLSGTAATATIAGTHLVAASTLGAGTGAAVKLSATCSSAKVMKAVGAHAGNKVSQAATQTQPSAENNKNTNEHTPACTSFLSKIFQGRKP